MRPALYYRLAPPSIYSTTFTTYYKAGCYESVKNKTNTYSSSPLILDSYTTTGRRLNSDYKSWWLLTEEEKRERKFKRAYHRFMLGVGMPGEYRFLTLTTPPDFKGLIHDAWRKFLKRMRRRGIIREYYIVKEWNKAHTCQHLHVVLRLD